MNLPKNRSIPDSTIMPELAYPDVLEAAAWLCKAFGFAERLRIGNHRVQLAYGNGAVIVRERKSSGETSGAGDFHSVMVRVEDVQGHHARCVQMGAKILRAPADFPYGERQYTVEDCGGHVWTFTQTIADVDPASWGGELMLRSQ